MGEITAKGVDSYPGGKDRYVDDVISLLKDLAGNPVSFVILGAILHTPRKLTIVPELERPDKRSGAAAVPAIGSGGIPDYAHASPPGLSRDGTDHDKWYAGRDDDDDNTDPYDPAPAKWGDPKGGGSSDIIYFTPHGTDETCARGSGMCAQQEDEILLHEMVHALRDMQGLTNHVPTAWLYKDEEEFLAIVVANVYISKKTGKNNLLRRDYRRVGPLEAPWNTSDGFLKDEKNRTVLEYYVKFWQPVFDQLGKVDTVFNPFRKVKVKTPRKP